MYRFKHTSHSKEVKEHRATKCGSFFPFDRLVRIDLHAFESNRIAIKYA